MGDRHARQHPADAVLAGGAAGHDVEQIVAAGGTEDRAALQRAEHLHHRHRGRAVAQVPQVALVGEQASDGAVDPHALDVVVDQPLLDRRGTAEVLDQEVGRAVARPGHHRLDQRARALAADDLAKAAAPGVDLVEIGGGYCDLHGRGHRIGLVAVDRDRLPGGEIERRDADVARAPGKQGRQLLLEALEMRARRRQRRLRGNQAENPGEQGDNAHLGSITFRESRRPAKLRRSAQQMLNARSNFAAATSTWVSGAANRGERAASRVRRGGWGAIHSGPLPLIKLNA